MTVALTLLGDVRWRGAPVAGERSQALLAALAAAGGRSVRAERLIDLVWGDEAPANATKGLQVLISRTRTACGADVILRDAAGYRLGVDPAEIDSARLAALVRDAAAALDDDAGPLTELRRDATSKHGRNARSLRFQQTHVAVSRVRNDETRAGARVPCNRGARI